MVSSLPASMKKIRLKIDAQGQITLESVVVSGRNLNSSKLLFMSSLPARMGLIK